MEMDLANSAFGLRYAYRVSKDKGEVREEEMQRIGMKRNVKNKREKKEHIKILLKIKFKEIHNLGEKRWKIKRKETKKDKKKVKTSSIGFFLPFRKEKSKFLSFPLSLSLLLINFSHIHGIII